MKRALPSSSLQKQATGFTIIEIALSLAIIATAFVGVLALLPAGLDASRRATQSTVVATILDSVHDRLRGELLTPRPGEGISFSPALFDAQGIYLPPDAPDEQLERAIYRVDLTLADWTERPAHTSSLRVVTMAVFSPVDGRTGKVPPAVRPLTVVSFPVATLTGTDWPAIAREYKADPTFEPKIGF